MPKISVKWGTKLLDVDANLEDPPFILKAQLFDLTEIPPERQKLLIKGKTIGDDSWEGIAIKEGSVIMLVGGTASTTIQSSNGAVGQNSPTKAAKQKDEIILPVGLKNLGNTCYMNATLQCFKVIPELDLALKKYSENTGHGNPAFNERNAMITNMLKKLYASMDQLRANAKHDADGSENPQPAIPLLFLHVLHQTLPQFATHDERGQLQQQDANECFCEVLRLLTDEMKYKVPAISGTSSMNNQQPEIPMKKFFEVEHQVTIKCKDEECKEEPQITSETHFQLNCYLSQDVRYIQTGIKSKMNEEIEKQSQSLGRNALYEKHSLISRLPAYLSVQIIRFYYKEQGNINAKILKDVKFPMVFDVFEMCTPELQEKLKPARQANKDYEEAKIEMQRKAKLEEAGENKLDTKPKGYFPTAFPDDTGSNNSGLYELKALITHKGRASNSGHYVAWVRIGDEEDEAGGSKWAACDDDEVYTVSEEEILKLSGGGDWHCAYVLLYGPKKIPQL